MQNLSSSHQVCGRKALLSGGRAKDKTAASHSHSPASGSASSSKSLCSCCSTSYDSFSSYTDDESASSSVTSSTIKYLSVNSPTILFTSAAETEQKEQKRNNFPSLSLKKKTVDTCANRRGRVGRPKDVANDNPSLTLKKEKSNSVIPPGDYPFSTTEGQSEASEKVTFTSKGSPSPLAHHQHHQNIDGSNLKNALSCESALSSAPNTAPRSGTSHPLRDDLPPPHPHPPSSTTLFSSSPLNTSSLLTTASENNNNTTNTSSNNAQDTNDSNRPSPNTCTSTSTTIGRSDNNNNGSSFESTVSFPATSPNEAIAERNAVATKTSTTEGATGNLCGGGSPMPVMGEERGEKKGDESEGYNYNFGPHHQQHHHHHMHHHALLPRLKKHFHMELTERDTERIKQAKREREERKHKKEERN